MAFGQWRNSGIPKIDNYEQALKLWTDTLPIRRRKTDDRPLGHRRNTWYLINKGEDDKIECKMYGTPLVTFHKDGRVEISNYAYNTTSTPNFIWDVTRSEINAYVFDHSVVIGTKDGLEQRLGRGGSLVLKRGDNGNYHFLDHKPEVTHTINRANAKAIRAKHVDFMQYVDNMAKLRGTEPYTRNELQNQLGNELYNMDLGRMRYINHHHSDADAIIDNIKKFKAWVTASDEDRFENYYKAMLIMAHSFGKYDWHNNGFVLHIDSMLRDFDKVLMGLYRDEYFDANTTPNGCAKRDTYRAYYTGVWDKYNSVKVA